MKISLLVCMLIISSMSSSLSYADDLSMSENTALESRASQSSRVDQNWIAWSKEKEQENLSISNFDADSNALRDNGKPSEQKTYIDEHRSNNWIEWSDDHKTSNGKNINKGVKKFYTRLESKSHSEKAAIKDGIYIEWHRNGQKKIQGAYKDGKKTGIWMEWDASGRKTSEEHYINGNLKKQG